MNLFTLTRGGTPLNFNVDGSVTDATGAARGSWSAQSAQRTNGIVYTPTAGAPVTLAVQYGFNANNQLTVAIPNNGSDPALPPTPVAGMIVVQDNQDLAYYAMADGNPGDLPSAFVLYGTIAIDPGRNVLTVSTGVGAALTVTGMPLTGNCALSTQMADNAQDQISFTAITQNPQPDGSSVDIPAQILLVGKWDVQEGQIKFVMNYTNTAGAPTLSIAIAGKLKGVAAGFEFYSAGGQTTLLFTIAGQIKGLNQSGQWELAIGYANNVLTASGSINDTIVTSDGSLALTGSFAIAKGGYTPLTIEVQLQAAWKFSNGQLVVSVARGATGGYNLALSGDLTVGNDWSVKFAATRSASGGSSFQIAVGYAPPNSPLNGQLSLYYSNNGLQLKVGLTVTLNFVDGALLPQPKAGAAS